MYKLDNTFSLDSIEFPGTNVWRMHIHDAAKDFPMPRLIVKEIDFVIGCLFVWVMHQNPCEHLLFLPRDLHLKC